MRIENGYFQQGTSYGKKSSRNTAEKFSDVMAKTQESFDHKIQTGDFYVNGTDCSNTGIYTKDCISQELELPIETNGYKIEDASEAEGVAAYVIKDKQTGRGLYIREDQLAIQKDEKTGLEFLINMDQPFSRNIIMTGELKVLLNDLSEKKNINLKETPLQGGLVVNHDPKTGLDYLSMSGNEAIGVSVIIRSEKDIETLRKLADEFQQYSVCSQRSTAELYVLFEISGNLKREKEGFMFLTPDGIRYIPYNGDPSKAWEIDMPNSGYAAARKYLATGTDCTNIKTWMKILKGIKIHYGDSYSGTSVTSVYKMDDLGSYCMFL